jgi:ribosomal protein S18 acetylase RimI-like enzyme
MTSPWFRTAEPPVHVRFAKAEDAEAICQLYIRTYTPRGGGTAREHYPFPQLMEEEKVIELITGGTVAWVVAEAPDGAIAGSAAAVRNIGGQQDRIAEIFGVAVDQNYRRQGVGSTLLKELQTELTNIAEFILCEARTAEAGGWKAARNAGFRPVGFEPYAHAMPIGFESMVLTAWCDWASQTPYREMGTPGNTQASLKLAHAVCPSATAALVSLRTTGYQLPNGGLVEDKKISPPFLSVRRDDNSGQGWFARSVTAFDRQFALVEFWPLQGVEQHCRRFEHAYYVASKGASDVAAAQVFYDRTDARARILGLRGTTDGVEPQFLEGIVENLLQLSGNEPMVIVLCVRTGTLETQIGLEGMGFFPTAYFPGMISVPNGRTDVVQYTRLVRRSWSESIRSVTALEWPEARRLIDQVVQFHVDSPTSASTN